MRKMFRTSVSMLLLFFAVGHYTILGIPLTHSPNDHEIMEQVETGSACNEIGEILSQDPCRPWCMCKDGAVICAEIFCNAENNLPEPCGKIKVNGRCCPSFVCVHTNGTASMHYPLPLTVVPPAMYEDSGNHELTMNNKRNIPHRMLVRQ